RRSVAPTDCRRTGGVQEAAGGGAEFEELLRRPHVVLDEFQAIPVRALRQTTEAQRHRASTERSETEVNVQPHKCPGIVPFFSVCLLSVFSVPLWFVLPLHAQQSYPMLMSISPVAVQIGTTTECEIEARYSLHGTYKIWVSGEGVTGEVDPPPALKP